MFEIKKLDNVTLIFSPSPQFATTSFGIFLRVGARFEERRVKGIAHFVEHMLFKGTKKYSYKDIKREIEGRGGSLNGFTSQEVSGFYAHFLSKNLKITVDILMDMVLNPCFKNEDIRKERNVILEEIKMYNDLPHYRALSLLDRIIWENHPLGEDVIGTFDSVKRIERDDLFCFKEKFYTPSNMVICCTGNFSPEKVTKLVKDKIKSLRVKKEFRPSIFPPSSPKGKKIIVETKPLDQTHLCVGFRAFSYRSRYRLILELIHVILGANMSSRLFEEIREKRGLCYDVSTEVKKFQDTGAFVIHVGLDKSQVVLALRCILQELKKIKRNLVFKKELDRAKDYFLGQFLMSLERPRSRLFYLADSYIALNRIYTFSQIKERIEKITREDILILAKRLFDFGHICVSCVGNVEKDLSTKLQEEIEKYK